MKTKKASKIFTVGHSNKTIEVFLGILKKHKIAVLVDVRTYPKSRFCPHFNQNALHDTLADATIQYLYRGLNLGGRGVNVGYDETIDELTRLAKKGVHVCVMCSEGDYHDCHRFSTLTPSFEDQGLNVVHIEYETKVATLYGKVRSTMASMNRSFLRICLNR
jgi:uncharacterized protein (DUF488 family)